MTTLRLKVTLVGTKPPIWRRFDVPGDVSLRQLHDILQIVMGWTDSHLHQFEQDGTLYGESDREFGLMRESERTPRVDNVLSAPKDQLKYDYDFWRQLDAQGHCRAGDARGRANTGASARGERRVSARRHRRTRRLL